MTRRRGHLKTVALVTLVALVATAAGWVVLRRQTSLAPVVMPHVTTSSRFTPTPPTPTTLEPSTTPLGPSVTTSVASPTTSARPPSSPTTSARPSSSPTTSPSTPSNQALRTIAVSSQEQLRQALADAQPGDLITLAAGTYTEPNAWRAAAAGSAAHPITLRGPRAAVLTSGGTSEDYGLYVTGDYWRIEGLTVANSSKGIIVERAKGTVIDSVHVHTIGEEAIAFRACSTDSVLRNSLVEDTGLVTPAYGEGVYVGTAQSNWDKPGRTCIDGKDHSNGTLIEGNTFRTIAAEGADLKEGTDNGTLRNNIFDNTAFSGANYADSAVDAQGNNWRITNNVVRNPSGAFLDGMQSHELIPGYGTGNVFSGNRIEGSIRGFGIGLSPQLNNRVSCDNSAPGAAKGLVGSWGDPVACS